MILKIIKKVNTIEEKIERYYEETINIKFEARCSKCESRKLEDWTEYERNIMYEENGEIKEKRIKIKRVRCKSCRRTHAIIPDFLVPYKQHSKQMINNVIEEVKGKGKSKKQVEREKGILRQLQLIWIRHFENIKSKVEITLEIFDMEKIIEKIKEEKFGYNYYKKNKEIYMLRRKKKFYNYITT